MPMTYKSISTAASGDTTILAGVAGHNYRVINYVIVSGGTTNITFKSGAAAVTGAMPLVANSGVSAASTRDAPLWESVALGDALVINNSAAIQISGHITFFDQ